MLWEVWAGGDVCDKGGEIGRSRQETSEGQGADLSLSQPWRNKKEKEKSQGCDDLIKKQLIIACACKVALLVGLQNGTITLEDTGLAKKCLHF